MYTFTEYFENENFTDLDKSDIDCIVRWCGKHDWCHKAYYDNVHQVFTVKESYDNEILEFSNTNDLFSWAGY